MTHRQAEQADLWSDPALSTRRRLFNRSELAELLEIAPTTLDAWRRRGMPCVRENHGRGGRAGWLFSLPAVVSWRIDDALHVSNRGSPPGSAGPEGDVEENRSRLLRAQAETHELKNAELRGELIRKDEAIRGWADRVVATRNRLRRIPHEAMLRVPGFGRAMAKPLLALVDEALRELAGDVDPAGRPKPRRPRRRIRTAEGANAG